MKMKKDKSVSLTGAQKALQQSAGEFIKTVVTDFYGVEVDKINSKNRKREVVKVRQVGMYLMFVNTTMGPSKIASLYKKDHATALHAYKVIDGYLTWDKDLITEVDKLQKKIEVKTKVLMKGLDLDKDYYYIDLVTFSSLKLENGKAIILHGFTNDEINEFKNLNTIQCTTRKHDNTQLYVLEKK